MSGTAVHASAAGAASREIVERCRALEGGGLRTFADDRPLTWERAEGWWVQDADGRRYLDLYGGYAVAATGYGHPRVVAAIREQAGRLLHCPSAFPSRVRAEFYEALLSVAPDGLDRVLPAVTGAMANEMAVAIARTRRPGRPVITFDGSYFGRGTSVVGFAGKARYRERLGVGPAGPVVPFPSPLRSGDRALDLTMERLHGVIDAEGPPAAVIVEPVQGNGGVVIPPSGFLPALAEVCRRTGALLILDEIQSGCGRTGRMWACEHAGVAPDLMTVGKGIGGGVPVAAVLGTAEAMSWEPDTYTSTFLTNALTLAAATATIGVLRDEDLPGRAARLGPRMLERLRRALSGVDGVVEVRGIGMWAGIELVDGAGRPDGARARAAVRAARERGVIVGRGGSDEQVVKLSPPLVIEEADLWAGLEVAAACVRDAA